jgi:hypothetical protein
LSLESLKNQLWPKKPAVFVGIALVLTTVLQCWLYQAFADSSPEDIALWSFGTAEDGVISLKAQRVTLFVLWILVIGILTVGVLSSTSHRSMDRLIRLGRGPDASNLFLGIQYRLSNGSNESFSGFIRTLGMKHATFVASRSFERGERIRLDLGTIIGFDSIDQAGVEAVVHKSKKMAGDNKHFLVEVKLNSMPEQVRAALARYLVQLASPRKAYSQV